MNRILAATLTLALCAAPTLAAGAPAAPAAPAAHPAAKAGKKPAKKAPAASHETFKTEDEKTFYAYGYKMGSNMAPVMGASAGEARAIAEGLSDALRNKPEAVNMATYLPRVSEMANKRMTAKADAEKAKGKAYAEKFAKEAGVKPIPMGGYIKIERAGSGAMPAADDTVKVNYRGTLIDGKEFDSSYSRHEPAEFPLKNVIPCWTNGVAMMKVGGKAKLVCPSDAAYGDQGHPPVIPGGATLVFDIELLDIVKPEAPKTEAPKSGEKPSK